MLLLCLVATMHLLPYPVHKLNLLKKDKYAHWQADLHILPTASMSMVKRVADTLQAMDLVRVTHTMAAPLSSVTV